MKVCAYTSNLCDSLHAELCPHRCKGRPWRGTETELESPALGSGIRVSSVSLSVRGDCHPCPCERMVEAA